jgi:hypothetical protein
MDTDFFTDHWRNAAETFHGSEKSGRGLPQSKTLARGNGF